MRLHLMRFGLVAVVAMAALSMSSRLAAQVPASDDSGAASSPEGPAGAAGTTGTASEKLKLDPNGRSDTPNFFLHIQLRPSTDKTYGFTKENPISTGISTEPPRQGATMMRLMLNSLRGPAGEAIEYERVGICCRFDRPNATPSSGFLDIVKLKIDGQEESMTVYFDIYNGRGLFIPVGLTQRPVSR